MIGERLKEIRRSRKIKQKDLGEILGVQKTNISLYESGKSSPNDIIKKKIAQFFNISIDYLVGLIDEPVPYYTDEVFLRLPENMTDEERHILSEFIKFLEYRRKGAK